MEDDRAEDPNDGDVAARNTLTAGGDIVYGDKITVGRDYAGRDIIHGYTAEQVSALLTQISTTFQPKPFDGRCPYLGLDAFDEADTDRFFGREKLVTERVAQSESARAGAIFSGTGLLSDV